MQIFCYIGLENELIQAEEEYSIKTRPFLLLTKLFCFLDISSTHRKAEDRTVFFFHDIALGRQEAYGLLVYS